MAAGGDMPTKAVSWTTMPPDIIGVIKEFTGESEGVLHLTGCAVGVRELRDEKLYSIAESYKTDLYELEALTGESGLRDKVAAFRRHFLQSTPVPFGKTPLKTIYEVAKLQEMQFEQRLVTVAMRVLRKHPEVRLRSLSDRGFRRSVKLRKDYSHPHAPKLLLAKKKDLYLALSHLRRHPEDGATIFRTYHRELLNMGLFGTYYSLLHTLDTDSLEYFEYSQGLMDSLIGNGNLHLAREACSSLTPKKYFEAQYRRPILERAFVKYSDEKYQEFVEQGDEAFFSEGMLQVLQTLSDDSLEAAFSFVRRYEPVVAYKDAETNRSRKDEMHFLLATVCEELDHPHTAVELLSHLPEGERRDRALARAVTLSLRLKEPDRIDARWVRDTLVTISDPQLKESLLFDFAMQSHEAAMGMFLVCENALSEPHKMLNRSFAQLIRHFAVYRSYNLVELNADGYDEKELVDAFHACENNKIKNIFIERGFHSVAGEPTWNEVLVTMLTSYEEHSENALEAVLKTALREGNYELVATLKERLSREKTQPIFKRLAEQARDENNVHFAAVTAHYFEDSQRKADFFNTLIDRCERDFLLMGSATHRFIVGELEREALVPFVEAARLRDTDSPLSRLVDSESEFED